MVVLWMSGALLSFSIMAVSLRALRGPLNVFEMLSIRSGCGILILAAVALARPALWRELVPRRMGLHLLRNVVHFGAQVGWAYSVLVLPLAVVFALEFTTPAWVALLAVLLLGERMTTSRTASVLLGFAGILAILRPGLEIVQPAALITLAAALGFAISIITTKKLTGSVSTFAILLWMNAIQLPLNLIGSDPAFLMKLDAAAILPALGVGISGLSAHFCLTNAFRSGDAILVVPLDFLRIPLIAVVGWTLYAEPIDAFVFAGAGLIVAGILWNLWAEAKRS